MAPPHTLRIPYEPEEWERFHLVGRLQDGTRFMAFVTGAAPGELRYADGPNWRSIKRWVAVVYRFDAEGNHVATEARLGGFDKEGRAVACEQAAIELEQMLTWEEAESCDIYVKPFFVEIDEIRYELVYENHEDEEFDYECVMLWPNDIMFHPPWDSGVYST